MRMRQAASDFQFGHLQFQEGLRAKVKLYQSISMGYRESQEICMASRV